MTQTKNLKKILSHKAVCEKTGKKPSTSLLWPVLGQSSGNEKERVHMYVLSGKEKADDAIFKKTKNSLRESKTYKGGVLRNTK